MTHSDYRLKNYIREILSIELIFPIALIGIYIVVLLAIRGSMPTSDELVSHFAALYARFGYEIIYIGAFLEALIIVSFFVPGVTALILGAVFARSGQLDLTWVVLTAALGALSGYGINFILGYFGFGKFITKLGYGSLLEKAKKNLKKFNIVTVAVGFIHPNIGCFMSLAAGTLRISFPRFIGFAGLVTLFWFSTWGLLVFAIGDVFLTIITKHFFVIVFLVLSILILSTLYSSRED